MRSMILVALAFVAASALRAQQIPLREGLGLVYAHKNLDKERESELLVEVLTVTPDEATMRARWLDPAARTTPMEEKVSRREMLGARTLSYGRQAPVDTVERRPRTVAMASQRVMRALRESGMADATLPVLMSGTAIPVDGTLRLVATTPEVLELVVEGAPRKLRTLHARGDFTNVVQGISIRGDWWFLDDTTAAWMVKNESATPDGRTFKMVLASAGAAAEARPRLEEQLAASCRSTVYGFYFASGRAELQPASAPTFRAVAEVLRKHPDWTLTVEGHTDSIGGAEFNRKLAEQRAAAVVKELTTRHGVAASRLTPAGYGAQRPVAANASLEGRARNRRVELVRACTGRAG